MDIINRLARRAVDRQPSPIRELQKYMSIEKMISLGGGYPNPSTFDFASVNVQFNDGQSISLGEELIARAAQYGPSDGLPSFKSTLLKWHQHKDNIVLDPENIVVLNGSQEGLFILAYLFLNSEDRIIVDEPTYPGAIAAFKSFCRNFISVPIDGHGTRTDVLEEKLSELELTGTALPKFIYCIPNGHNPGGVAMSLERRRQLIDIANRYDLFIVEDDPYQLIKLDDSPLLPSLQSMDTDGRVIRLDSFSKIFAPGLRLGYVTASPAVAREIVLFKQASNMHTSTFVQLLVQQYLNQFGFDQFYASIQKKCELYRTHRDAMVSAAQKYLPESVTFHTPTEGMFIWFELPPSFDARQLVDRYATELKVLLVPGNAFSTGNGCRNCMRASFSLVPPDKIEAGIQRFGKMIQLAGRQ